MTRKEFEEALIPFTQSELKAMTSPNINGAIYTSLMNHKSPDDPDYRKLIKNRIFSSNSNILPNRTDIKNFKSPDIAFNRNDRFLNIPAHNHYGYIEMNYVLFGNASALINDKIVPLATNDLCIMDSGVMHTILPTGENDIMLNILLSTEYFSNSFLTTLLNGGPVAKFLAEVMVEKNDHNQYLLFHTARSTTVKELIETMILEYLYPGICCKDVLYFNLNLLFIELARCYQEHMERKEKKKDRHYLTEILAYIENHCNECTLDDLAGHFHFNPKYLSRMLKQETGSNFQDILLECRMKRAGFLLASTDTSVFSVANDCGYQNQAFFRQKFTEHYGRTPSEYRKNPPM